MAELKYPTPKALFTAICDSVRKKDGTTEIIGHQDLPERIEAIPSGDRRIENSLVDGSVVDYRNDDVTVIGSSAFHARANLISASFAIADTVTSNAFYRCPNLKVVEFGNAATIGANVFYQCTSLIAVIIKSRCTLSNANSFSNGTPIADGTGYIYVPKEYTKDYQNATNWSTFASQIRAIEDYLDEIRTLLPDFEYESEVAA